jgi:hypothetical protein
MRMMLASVAFLLALSAVSGIALADPECNHKVAPRITIRASFAHDRGCIFGAIVINGRHYTDIVKATPKAMAVLKWRSSGDARRRELAEMWVDDVLMRVHEFRYASSPDAGSEFEKLYYPQKIESKGGSVVMRFWRDDTIIGMREPTHRDLAETEVTIDPKGRMTMKTLQTHAEPWR